MTALLSFVRRLFHKPKPRHPSVEISFEYEVTPPITIRVENDEGKFYPRVEYQNQSLHLGVYPTLDDAITTGYVAAGRIKKTLALKKPPS